MRIKRMRRHVRRQHPSVAIGDVGPLGDDLGPRRAGLRLHRLGRRHQPHPRPDGTEGEDETCAQDEKPELRPAPHLFSRIASWCSFRFSFLRLLGSALLAGPAGYGRAGEAGCACHRPSASVPVVVPCTSIVSSSPAASPPDRPPAPPRRTASAPSASGPAGRSWPSPARAGGRDGSDRADSARCIVSASRMPTICVAAPRPLSARPGWQSSAVGPEAQGDQRKKEDIQHGAHLTASFLLNLGQAKVGWRRRVGRGSGPPPDPQLRRPGVVSRAYSADPGPQPCASPSGTGLRCRPWRGHSGWRWTSARWLPGRTASRSGLQGYGNVTTASRPPGFSARSAAFSPSASS